MLLYYETLDFSVTAERIPDEERQGAKEKSASVVGEETEGHLGNNNNNGSQL